MNSESNVPEASTVYTGRRIEVQAVSVRTRVGTIVQRDLVVHPGAVVVLPLLADGRVVMIRNRRFAVDAELWELPAGTLEPPEPPAKCAERELIEEAGYQARTIQPLGRFFTTPGFCNEDMHAFVATDLTEVGQATEPGEDIRVELVGWDRVKTMMSEGEIADAKTIATLGLYLLKRDQL